MKEDRYQQILKILSDGRYTSVEQLSEELFVSLPTIRRDLTAMQDMGLVVRSHGGVVKRSTDNDGAPQPFRAGVNTGAKLKIAKAAAGLLRDNSVIFLDESTTAMHLIDHLSGFSNITVITNNMSVLQRLYKYRIAAYCLGGGLDYNTMSFYGAEAMELVERFGIDTVFFSSSALTPSGMIADYCEDANEMRRKVLQIAETSVFLCDKSKIGKHGLHILAPLKDIDYLITDGQLPDDMTEPGKVITV